MKKLPIGIQNITEILTENYLYIDKTALIHQLITGGKTYFLSRPRRFGKSLLISTLEAIFQGKKALFDGLAIAKTDWQWQEHPIIRLDFSELTATDADTLTQNISVRLHEIAAQYHLRLPSDANLQQLFIRLITELASINSVVVLIDEYDKPILDSIQHPEQANVLRNILRNFYTIIKARDQYIKFVFLTGISKFSQMSVFSGLNNLDDISMDPIYASLLGCTEQEIDDYFSDYVAQLAHRQKRTIPQTRNKMRLWYNGFRFTREDIRVYTPYSLLLLFKKQMFDNYWFSTATPAFLINLIRSKNYNVQAIEAKQVGRMAFASYDIENLRVLPLLLQTGYLTIAHYREDDDDYDLAYPNLEVKESFTQSLAEMLTSIAPEESSTYVSRCLSAVKHHKLETFFSTLQAFFANVPYQIQLDHESYYHSIFYVLFTLLGLKIHAEVQTNQGRIDAVIETSERIYVIEFKLDGSAESALQQIQAKKYYQKYLTLEKTIVLVGVNFSKQTRNIADYLVALVEKG